MKKVLIVTLALVLAASCAMAAAVDLSAYSDDELRALKSDIETELMSRAAAAAAEGGAIVEGDIKDAHVALTGVRRSTDYDKTPCAVLSYTWTNNDDEAAMFSVAVGVTVYQDGVELDHAIMPTGANTGDTIKKIKPGATLSVENGFKLTSDSPLEIEIKGLFDWGSNPATLTVTVPCP